MVSKQPSNELLSAILGEDIIDIEIIDTTVTSYYMQHGLKNFITRNIHELAHKCKEWTYKQGYMFIIYAERNLTDIYINKNKVKQHNILAHTELEAIFEACKWILEQQNKQLKTSKEWCEENSEVVIIDPDGWDRKNYEYSFNEEKITKDEFMRRRSYSTCMFKGK